MDTDVLSDGGSSRNTKLEKNTTKRIDSIWWFRGRLQANQRERGAK